MDSWRSGDWRVNDMIFEGRLRVLARGAYVEIRLEGSNGDLFALCPIHEPGMRNVAVEGVADSSRYFVLRVEDPATKRHAFLGMGFDERGDAFDFNAALSDHERQLRREAAVESASAAAAGGGASPSGCGAASMAADEAVAALHRDHGDLSLKEGQTIRVNVKKPATSKPGGLLSRAGDMPLAPLRPPSGGGALAPLAPPPGVPAAAGAAHQQQPPPPAVDLLGLGSDTLQASLPAVVSSNDESSWATFD